jgi:hypothetical protein
MLYAEDVGGPGQAPTLSSYFAPFPSPFQRSHQIPYFSCTLYSFYVAGKLGEDCLCKLAEKGGGGFGAKYDYVISFHNVKCYENIKKVSCPDPMQLIFTLAGVDSQWLSSLLLWLLMPTL